MRVPVDVVVPVRASYAEFVRLADRLRRLDLLPHDTLTIVDNTLSSVSRDWSDPVPMTVLRVPEPQSSYHARNRGAAVGSSEWIVFIDADVDVSPDLLHRFFERPPSERTAVLTGGVRDKGPEAGSRESLAGRYARLRRLMDHDNNLRQSRPYAKTANCAVRRTAFDEIGGFSGNIRSGGDADLCFRLSRAGWDLELRAGAIVEHRARRSLVDLLGQRARHGSGAEWLEERYPGFAGSREPWSSIGKSLIRGTAGSIGCLTRGDGDLALMKLLDPWSNAAFQIGRRVPNLPFREQSRLGGIGHMIASSR